VVTFGGTGGGAGVLSFEQENKKVSMMEATMTRLFFFIIDFL